jgi:integrase/recombinase XerD
VRQAAKKTTAASRHVEAFLEMLVAERGAAALTRDAYGRDLAHAAAHLAKRELALEKAQLEDLRSYVVALGRAEISPRTLARRLSALRQFYRFLVVDGVRRDDPTAGLDAPRLGRPLPKTLAQEDVTQLIAVAERDKSADGARLYAVSAERGALLAIDAISGAVLRDLHLGFYPGRLLRVSSGAVGLR